jgi:hypothetical protein
MATWYSTPIKSMVAKVRLETKENTEGFIYVD